MATSSVRARRRVQIPLWTIVTGELQLKEYTVDSGSDSSMDDCNFTRPPPAGLSRISSDSSMDDCNKAVSSIAAQIINKFRFLYGRL